MLRRRTCFYADLDLPKLLRIALTSRPLLLCMPEERNGLLILQRATENPTKRPSSTLTSQGLMHDTAAECRSFCALPQNLLQHLRNLQNLLYLLLRHSSGLTNTTTARRRLNFGIQQLASGPIDNGSHQVHLTRGTMTSRSHLNLLNSVESKLGSKDCRANCFNSCSWCGWMRFACST